MNAVQQVASLHEDTVQDAAEHSKKRRRPRAKGTKRVHKVTRTKVSPAVWRKAVRVAGGDVTLLVVRGRDAVTVANSPAHAETLRGKQA